MSALRGSLISPLDLSKQNLPSSLITTASNYMSGLGRTLLSVSRLFLRFKNPVNPRETSHQATASSPLFGSVLVLNLLGSLCFFNASLYEGFCTGETDIKVMRSRYESAR